MARKVFISFLGTGVYKPCVYKTETVKSTVVTYVQDAILQLYCKDWQELDTAYIFLTDGAKKKHWEALSKCILEFKYSFTLKPIENIPNGNTENEIWDIFSIVFSQLQEGDEIILDITHGFRSLPMLAMVLLNHAKFIKKINVLHIFYGAFEALKSSGEIDDKDLKPEDRLVPLFDLTSFSELQDWANATSDFVEFGNSKRLVRLINNQATEATNLLPKKERDKIMGRMKTFSRELKIMTEIFSTNRGKKIIEGDFAQNIISSINSIKDIPNDVKSYTPLKELFGTIERKVNVFEKNNVLNGFKAVEWCIESNLIQQGITLLQEVLVSYCLEQIGLDCKKEKANRDIVSKYLSKDPTKDYRFSDMKEAKEQEVDIIDKLKNIDNITIINNILSNLANEIRNDINHASFGRDGLEGEKFEKRLISHYQTVKEKIIKPN